VIFTDHGLLLGFADDAYFEYEKEYNYYPTCFRVVGAAFFFTRWPLRKSEDYIWNRSKAEREAANLNYSIQTSESPLPIHKKREI